jgi:hypothetical protein
VDSVVAFKNSTFHHYSLLQINLNYATSDKVVDFIEKADIIIIQELTEDWQRVFQRLS